MHVKKLTQKRTTTRGQVTTRFGNFGRRKVSQQNLAKAALNDFMCRSRGHGSKAHGGPKLGIYQNM